MKITTDLLQTYFRGQASEEQIRAIHAWVKQDVEHERLFRHERRLYDLLSLHGEQMVLDSDARYNLSSGSSKRVMGWLSKVAAVALVLVLSGWLGAWLYRQHVDTGALSQTSIQVPVGQRTHVVLSDGSEVWLHGGSSLTYPAMFAQDERRVRLHGEGYFQVSKDAERPFRVAHYAGEVEVLGTSFNMVADSLKGIYSTHLIEGRVRMKFGDSTAIVLRAGQYASLENGHLHCSTIKDYDSFDWRHGYITFTNKTFPQIIAKLESEYRVPIRLQDGDWDVCYTGKFRYDDGLDYALRVLSRDVPFEVIHQDNGTIVIRHQ